MIAAAVREFRKTPLYYSQHHLTRSGQVSLVDQIPRRLKAYGSRMLHRMLRGQVDLRNFLGLTE